MTVVQTYGVDVVFHGRDQGAQAMADKLGVSLTGLQGRLDGAAAMLERVGVAAAGLATGAAAMGLRGLLYGVTNLNAQARETAIGIAGMLQAGGAVGTFEEGMGRAGAVLTQIRRDADALPGEAQDFVNVFRTALPSVLDAGVSSVLDASRFTNQFGAVAVAFQVDSGQAGRDLRQMLQGRAGADVAMWNNLSSLIGKSAKEFNHLTAPQRLAALQSAVGRYGDMIGAYGGTFGTALSTVESKAKDLLRTASEPLYESATQRLQELGGWMTVHGPQFEAQVQRWGQRGADAFDRIFERGRHAVTYVRDHWREFTTEALAKGRELAVVYGGLRLGSAGIGIAQGVAPLLGAAGGGAELAALLSPVGLAAGVVTLALGAMAVAVHDGHVDLAGAAAELRPQFAELKTASGELFTALRPLVDTAGKQLFESFVGIAQVSAGAAAELLKLQAGVWDLTSRLASVGIARPNARDSELLSGPHALPTPINSWWAQHQRDRARASEVDPLSLLPVHNGPAWGDRAHNRAPRTPAHNPHRTTITNNFKIEQADNPERLALSVAHVIRRQLANPTTDPRSGGGRLR